MRTQRALDGACVLGVAALAVAALGICLWKTGHVDLARWTLIAAAVLPWLGATIGALRPLPALLPARLLDRAARTPDLIASAFAFGQLPADERTPFMAACVARASEQARRTPAAQAAPLRAPRALRPALVLCVAVLALLGLELQRPAPVIARPVTKPRLLHEEDLSAVTQELASMRALAADDPALRGAMNELNALLEALHDGELDRLQALRELRALEQRVELDALSEDDAALREALKAVGRSLQQDGQDGLAKELADALAQADAAKARAEAERLAAQLAQQPPPKPAAQQLARALERAGKQKPAGEADARQKKLQDEIARLLKKQREGQALSESEQRLLKKKQRELEQLQREQQQQAKAERKLEQLQRELGASGGALGQGQQESASQHMQQGARELERVAKQQMSAEQREKLKQTLQQLRELISKQQQQQGKNGGTKQAQSGQGQGQGQVQRLDLGRFGQLARGQGQDGQKPQDGSGEQGQGQPNGLRPGQGGKPAGLIEMDGEGDDNGASRLQLNQGTVLGGSAAGLGGRPQALQAPTKLDGVLTCLLAGGHAL
ncbi:MAG TPA: hypothetical protein VK509_12915, partial [Polyangiales bacterium]|nr:hypothetical protein [Polyangiales bacterium]